MNSPFVDIEEMSRLLNVKKSWIYQRTRIGSSAIPHVKMGKYVKFKPDEVLAFFENNDDSKK